MKNIITEQISPQHIFAAGIAVLPAFIMQDSISVKWAQVCFYILLSYITGKKILILPNIIMISGIVFANLITPVGQIIFSIAGFHVTTGALHNGFEKSALLIGMIYLSRFSVGRGVYIPGKTGSLLSLVFFYFEKILEGGKFTKGNIIRKIDERIISVHNSSADYKPVSADPVRTTFSGWLFLAFFVSINWFMIILNLFL